MDTININGGKKQNLGGDDEIELNLPDHQSISIKGILGLLKECVDSNDDSKRVISLGIGDPTAYSCFYTNLASQQAVVDALRSAKFNGYPPTNGLPQTRKAIAEYLSNDLPYKLCADDVYVTAGCSQAIEVALSILARPGANILLPRPGFPLYGICAAFRNIEIRYFDLVPENKWEVDLQALEDLADHNTVAMVIINPGNPCGNVYTYQHLEKIAQTAKKLGIVVIADEVYGHLVFGDNYFVPMGVFGSIAPVLTLGSLSKRWLVPGWRIGWLVTTGPNESLKNPKFVGRIKKYCDICGSPATFIQAAVPAILEQTQELFFRKTNNILKQTSDLCYQRLKEISCVNFPCKPQGSMTALVKLDRFLLKDINDDVDFCFKLAKEESLIILPGTAVGLRNWIRIMFACEPFLLEEALERLKLFCQRHSY